MVPRLGQTCEHRKNREPVGGFFGGSVGPEPRAGWKSVFGSNNSTVANQVFDQNRRYPSDVRRIGMLPLELSRRANHTLHCSTGVQSMRLGLPG